MTKQNEVDPDTNYQRLTLKWASKASLTQRKGMVECRISSGVWIYSYKFNAFCSYLGRAGRVSDGHCFRLISARMFDELDDYCTPEMKVGIHSFTMFFKRISYFE